MRFLRGHDGPIRGLAYAPDGLTLASVDDEKILLWEPASGQIRAESQDHAAASCCVAFSPDGQILASGTAWGDVFVWDSTTGEIRDRFGSHPRQAVNAMTFVAGGEFLVTGTGDRRDKRSDGQAGFFDIASRERLILHLYGGPVWSLASDPKGEMVIFGTRDRIMITSGFRCKQMETWAKGARMTAPGSGSVGYSNVGYYQGFLTRAIPRSRARSIALSTDGSTLAVASGRDLELWELAEGRLQANLGGHEDGILALAFAPDGRTLASAGRDGTVRLWGMVDGSERACHDWGIGRVHCLALAPDGMTMAAGGDSGLVVWDVE